MTNPESQDILPTIFDLVNQAHRRELYLPAIQRGMVWDEENIQFLIDSLLRGYPIGTFMIWETDRSDLRVRDFIPNMRTDAPMELNPAIPPGIVRLVLDGQQRLQAFLIAFFGSLDGKYLWVNLKGKKEQKDDDPDDELYELSFLEDTEASKQKASGELLFRIADVYFQCENVIKQLEKEGQKTDICREIQSRIKNAFEKKALLIHLDKKQDINEVVNIFIRINKEGIRLSRADLIMALIKTKWDSASQQFEYHARQMMPGLDSTFILRWCLLFIGKGIDFSNIPAVADKVSEIQLNFSEIVECIEKSKAIINDAIGSRTDIVGNAGISLLPLLYFVKEGGNLETDVNKRRIIYWLYWTHLLGQFSNRGATKVRICVDVIKQETKNHLPVEKMIDMITQRYSHVLKKDLRDLQTLHELAVYGKYAVEFLRIFQKQRVGQSGCCSYHVDHIFPYSKLKAKGLPDNEINNIGNYRLYLGILNEKKSADDPSYHIKGKTPILLYDEFGIDDPKLFSYDRFYDFCKIRQEQILKAVKAALDY